MLQFFRYLLLSENIDPNNPIHTLVLENCKLSIDNKDKAQLIYQKEKELLRFSKRKLENQAAIADLKATIGNQGDKIERLKKEKHELKNSASNMDLICFDKQADDTSFKNRTPTGSNTQSEWRGHRGIYPPPSDRNEFQNSQPSRQKEIDELLSRAKEVLSKCEARK